MGLFKRDIDVGKRKPSGCGGYVKLRDDEYVNKFFDGSNGFNQIKNITKGKVYRVVGIVGYGDVEDIVIIDDYGNQDKFCSYFFDEVD